jgi:hypothetical protein
MKPKMLSTNEKRETAISEGGRALAMYWSQTADVVDAAAGHQHNLRLRTKPQTRR